MTTHEHRVKDGPSKTHAQVRATAQCKDIRGNVDGLFGAGKLQSLVTLDSTRTGAVSLELQAWSVTSEYLRCYLGTWAHLEHLSFGDAVHSVTVFPEWSSSGGCCIRLCIYVDDSSVPCPSMSW